MTLSGQAITEAVCRFCGKENTWANTNTLTPCYDCMARLRAGLTIRPKK